MCLQVQACRIIIENLHFPWVGESQWTTDLVHCSLQYWRILEKECDVYDHEAVLDLINIVMVKNYLLQLIISCNSIYIYIL